MTTETRYAHLPPTVFLGEDDEYQGFIMVRIQDSSDSVQVPVRRFDQMTLHDVVADLIDHGYLSEDASFFGYQATVFGQQLSPSMMTETLEYLDIDDGATLSIQEGRPSTRDEVEDILRGIGHEASYDEHDLLYSLDLSLRRLTRLPQSFGQLRVRRDLELGNNRLTSLPESFGQLRVGGDLWLQRNQLTSLPESFGQLRIGGGLILSQNQLTSLPESFGQLRIGTSLSLVKNQLRSLPESFGQLRIGDSLILSINQLRSLPESFGQVRVGGNLDLSDNELTSLPESFGQLRIHDSLDLSGNELTSLPESFGQLIVGGSLDISENQIGNFPDSIDNIQARVLRLDSWADEDLINQRLPPGVNRIEIMHDYYADSYDEDSPRPSIWQ